MLDALISQLVINGYMVSYHEATIYLHTSQGKRWAMIEPSDMGSTLTLITDDGEPRYAGASGIETVADMLMLLGEVVV